MFFGYTDAFSFFTGIGWSLAGGYEPVLDLNVPGVWFVSLVSLGPHVVSPTVEVNRSFTGVPP